MKAILMDGYGGPEVLYLGDAPKPVAGDGEIVIRVESIGVNPADGKWRSGMFASFNPLSFPHIPGYDVAGAVEAGDGFAPGTKVAATVDHIAQGAYAQYATTRASSAAVIPQGMDIDIAAAVPTPGLTGLQIVMDGLELTHGHRVLVTGATGAVGRYAVYAAKERGCEVVAAVRESQCDEALAQGADVAIAIGRVWTGEPFDLVVDTVGGPDVALLCRSVRSGGIIRTAATTPIPAEGLPATPEFFAVHTDGVALATLLDAVAQGKIAVRIAATFPLAQAGEAQRVVDAGGMAGKVILKP